MVVALMVSFIPSRALSQGQTSTELLEVSYSDRGLEIVEVKATNKVVNPDGSISANVELVAKSSLTYGFLLSVENGTVSGDVIDVLLRAKSASIPLVGKKPLSLGRVTFSQGARLKVKLDKFGVRDGESFLFLFFDAITALLLVLGYDYLPTRSAEFWQGTYEALLGAINDATKNIGFDLAILTEQLRVGDYLGAIGTVGDIIKESPEAFVIFLLSRFGIKIDLERMKDLGGLLKGGVKLVFLEVPKDLFRRPRSAEVLMQATSPRSVGFVDVVLVIDRSGSMSGQKINDAKVAAKLFVDLMRDGDRLGIVSFASWATIDYQLSALNQATKQSAKSAIDAIFASGGTSIGAGLQLAQQEFDIRGNPKNPHAIVLLSDGDENVPPFVRDVLPSLIAAKTTVFTIGLGSAINELLLQDIAIQTGGQYLATATSAQLAAIYNRLAGRIAGQQVVTSGKKAATFGTTDILTILDASSEASFTVAWNNASVNLDLFLIRPNGQLIDPSSAANDPYIEHLKSSGYESYRIVAPERGVWTLRIYNPPSPFALVSSQTNTEYSYAIYARSGLKLQASASANLVARNEPILLSAVLNNEQGGVNGAEIVAKVQPLGDIFYLYDNGLHGDSYPNDGVYTAVYTRTVTVGTYNFEIAASGNGYTRQAETSIVVSDHLQRNSDLWLVVGSPREVKAGDIMLYEATIGNLGPNGIDNFRLEFRLPVNAAFISSTLGVPTLISTNVLQWTVSAFATSQASNFSLATLVDSKAVAGDTVVSYMSIKALGQVNDPTLANNVVTLTTTIIPYRAHLPLALREAIPSAMPPSDGTPTSTATPTPPPASTPTPTPTSTPTPLVQVRNAAALPSDAEIGNLNCSSWPDCRAAVEGNYLVIGYPLATVGSYLLPEGYDIKRVFLYFDTSFIPPNATITQATLNFYADQFLDGNTTVHVVQSTASHPDPRPSDYSRLTLISGGSVNAQANTWMAIPLAPSALSWITKGGITKLALVHDADVRNITPTTTGGWISVSLYEYTERRPYLTVSYTLPYP